MKRFLFFLVILPLMGCATTDVHVQPDRPDSSSVVFVIDESDDPLGVGPIIVQEIEARGYNVERVSAGFFRPERKSSAGPRSGSGFLVTADGFIVTNSHLIEGFEKVSVRQGTQAFEATVIVNDRTNDIAILKADTGPFEHYLPVSSQVEANVGDPILVVGFPLTDILGEEPRITNGIISARSGIGGDPTRVQVTAAIQPGNSGGPILNGDFQVIGIATEKLSDAAAFEATGALPQNVNFGVKIQYVEMLLTDLVGEPSVPTQSASLEQGIGSTVQIFAGTGGTGVQSTSVEYVMIEYGYTYSWDLIHYMLTSLSIRWIDHDTGRLIAQGTHSGSTLQSYRGTTTRVVRDMLDQF